MRGAWVVPISRPSKGGRQLHTRCSGDGARSRRATSLHRRPWASPWRPRGRARESPRNCSHGVASTVASASATAGEEASAKRRAAPAAARESPDRKPSRLLQGHAGRARARPRSSAARYPCPACMSGLGSRFAAAPRTHRHPHYQFLTSLSCVGLAPSHSPQARRSCARFPVGFRAAHASQARVCAGRQDG
jgi:hypothetical protein